MWHMIFYFSQHRHKKIISYQFITENNEAGSGGSNDEDSCDAFYEFNQFCRPLETALDTTLASDGFGSVSVISMTYDFYEYEREQYEFCVKKDFLDCILHSRI